MGGGSFRRVLVVPNDKRATGGLGVRILRRYLSTSLAQISRERVIRVRWGVGLVESVPLAF